MQSNSEKKLNNNIYELPSINTKYSGKLVSRVVTITFGLILLFAIIALLVVTVVEIDVTIDATGQLEPSEVTSLHSSINGEIKKVFVRSGVAFHKGDLLVQFDSVKLSDQLNDLNDKLSMKLIDYERKSRSLPFEKKQLDIQEKKSEAQLLKAKAGLRQKINDFFTGADPDSIIQYYKKGTHITMDYALADINSAEADVDNIHSQKEAFVLKNLELKSLLVEVDQIKRSVAKQKEYINRTKLIAPFDGVVLTPNVENLEGSFVSEGSPLFEISKRASWKAVLNINEGDAYKVNVGDSVKIEVKAMKLDDNYMLLPGKILNISGEPYSDNAGQQSSGMYLVEVEIETKNHADYLAKLKRGFSIEAKIIKDRDRIINVLIKNIIDIF